LAEELGRGLVPEPLISAAMAVRLLPRERIAGVLSGNRIILPAWQDSIGAMGPGDGATIVGGRLTGTKQFVAQAGGADAFVAVIRDGLALVQAGAPGFRLVTEGCQDGSFFGTLSFEGVEFVALPPADIGVALDEATLATAAYLLGVMDRAFAITLDYLRIRQQFGRPIGSFQALQHRAADMKIQIELTRASVTSAAVALDGGADADGRRAKVSQAKARASEAVMLVARECVQMHGAIGYTDEGDIGLYLRKAMSLANLYGSAAVHRRRYAAVA
jgi:alkylation response protein AidB-like acyl-CoA dehydrogenase